MYPHIKSLESNRADEPFVVLGVNSDKDRDDVKKTLVDQKITWRSFWNGGSTNGPISRAWKITGYPTLFLIDDRGVIRDKWLGTPAAETLDKAVEALVKQAGEKE